MRQTLTELCNRFGTDKGTTVGGWPHAYSELYEPLFAPWRDQVVRLLEIGVFDGASLRVWETYFGAWASVFVGLDNDPDCCARARWDAVLRERCRVAALQVAGHQNKTDSAVQHGRIMGNPVSTHRLAVLTPILARCRHHRHSLRRRGNGAGGRHQHS